MNSDDLIGALILCIIFIVYIISMIFRFTLKDFPTSVRYIETCEMKTGDILCVAYNNHVSVTVCSMTNSAWIHTAMVWVDPETNIRYVLEGCLSRQEKYRNFYKIPVTTWLYCNRGHVIGYKRYNGNPVDPHKMIEVFNKFAENCKLEGFNYTWFRFLFKDNYEKIEKLRKKYTCFEITIILGQESGIYKKNRSYHSFFPCHIVNDGIDMENNGFYSKVIQCHQNPCESLLLKKDKNKYKDFWKS